MGRGQSFSPPKSQKRTHPKVADPSHLFVRNMGPPPYFLDQTELSGLHPEFLAKAVDLGVDFTSDEQKEAGEV